MAKMYGNLINRFEEGKNFAPIEVGTDITMYYYSDRTCYYVTRVIDNKHIFVKRYHVCADHDSAPMSNNWKYFKSKKEMNDYLRKYFPERDYDDTDSDIEEEWTFRYGNWKHTIHRNYSDVIAAVKERKEFDEYKGNTLKSEEEYIKLAIFRLTSTMTNAEKLAAGKEITEYFDLSGKISFGVRDYYYDYEF